MACSRNGVCCSIVSIFSTSRGFGVAPAEELEEEQVLLLLLGGVHR